MIKPRFSVKRRILHPEYSFYKGWLQVKLGDAEEVRAKLMAVFNTDKLNVFYHRIQGRTELKHSYVVGVEEVFKQYGITDIWGEI